MIVHLKCLACKLQMLRIVTIFQKGVTFLATCGIRKIWPYERRLIMEIVNLILFGTLFYLAIIGVPTLCERRK